MERGATGYPACEMAASSRIVKFLLRGLRWWGSLLQMMSLGGLWHACNQVATEVIHCAVSWAPSRSSRQLWVLYFLRCGFFSLQVTFPLSQKNIICSKKKILRQKKQFGAERKYSIIFLRTQYFSLVPIPQILKVVKKVFWAIP